jgi:hypothetical protein
MMIRVTNKKTWWGRFTGYAMWDKEDWNGGTIPYVSFSFETIYLKDRELLYFDSGDKDRWGYLLVRLCISRLQVNFDIPLKRLPDYIPTEKVLKRRGNRGTPKV